MNEYEKLINDVVEISKLSTKENSILYNFSLDKDSVKSNISIVDLTGEKKVLKTSKFNLESKFYNFVNPLLEEFIDNNEIVLSDFVDMDADNIVTYRLITSNNDQFTIDGLTFEDANYIRDVVSDLKTSKRDKPKVLTLEDDSGTANIWFVITLVILIGLVIACSAYFV